MKRLEKLLLIIFIFVLLYFTKDINMLPLTVSFSMYMLFSGIFSTTGIKKVIGDYHNDKYYYSRDKIFGYSIISITLIGIFLIISSYFIGNILDIDKIDIINIFMSISLIVNILLKLIVEYLDIIGYKKISNNLINIYNIVNLIIYIILSILLYNVFKLDNYINIIILYLVNVIIFVIIAILLYILIFSKKKKYTKKREENKINYITSIRDVIVNNQVDTIFNITNNTYNYISMIILYYTLINKYNYSYEVVSGLITNTYLYGLVIFYLLYKYIIKYLDIDYNNIKNNFINNINKIIKVSLSICILLMIISIPLNNILFSNNYNYLSSLIPLLFFYILYIYIMNINIKYNKNKSVVFILIVSLIIKIIFEIPLIDTMYRMGYSLILGSILSTITGFIISIIIGIIFIKNKFKISLLDNFNNLLNIIYESIIYALVLVLFAFIVKIDNNGIINNILVIIFYVFITIIFYIIKRFITKK